MRRSNLTFAKIRQLTAEHRQAEDGALIIFSLFVFVAMIAFGGVAVDLMLYENARTHIQNSTDRAVLAAANLDQSVDPKVVVVDYMAKVGITVDPDDVVVTEVGTFPVITGRQVSVNVQADFPTALMPMLGVNSLPFGSVSEAEEAVNDIEVSLILDVSGSMGSGSKLSNMQSAAKEFVSKILAGSQDDRVSLSLVPYSTQVSAGPELLEEMSVNDFHNYSHCVNFSSSDFNTTAIDHDAVLSQTAHFDPWRGYWVDPWTPSSFVCLTDDFADIVPWSNDAAALNTQIDSFTAGGNTSIDVAIKWGTALLDPSMSSVLNAMADKNTTNVTQINEAFRPRPHAYSNDDSLKFIVVMTDGINTSQYYLEDDYKYGTSPVFKKTSNGDYYMKFGNNWWNATDHNWEGSGNPFGTSTLGAPFTQLSWAQVWAEMGLRRKAYSFHYKHNNYASDYYDNLYSYRGGPRSYVSANTKDTRMDSICDAAKANDIVVFTIGFEVTDHSANVMRSCASTPNHFYRVDGLDIETAFASIANQINQLKLTQ